ncbi:MAG: VOC family protein [bacterium]
MKNMINWFEIPAVDFERAKKFYETILDCKMDLFPMGEDLMACLPMEGNGISGAIVKGKDFTPSLTGVIIYLNGNDDLDIILNRVEPAGGKVAIPKSLINAEIGYFARFIDTEGNMMALHSQH